MMSLFFVVLLCGALQAEEQQQAMASAEKAFLQQEWSEASTLYTRMLANVKGEEMARVNDRLGDIQFYLDRPESAVSYYVTSMEFVLGRTAGSFLKMKDKLDTANTGELAAVNMKMKIDNAFIGQLRVKTAFVGIIIKYNQHEQAPLLKKKYREFLSLYHQIIGEKGFRLDVDGYNAHFREMSKIADEALAIVEKIEGKTT